MMKIILLYKRIGLLIGLVCLLGSCKKEYVLPTGKVYGSLMPEGVKVTFDRGDRKFSALTGADGQFVVENLEAGIYKVTLEKEGYYTFKKFGFQFFGGPSELYIDGLVSLEPKYTSTVTIDSAIKEGNFWISISGTYQKNDDYDGTGSIMNLNIQWFVNDKKGVSPTNFKYSTRTNNYRVENNLYTTAIALDKKYFANSRAVYIIGYAKPGTYSYFDWEKNQKIYAIGDKSSNEFTFNIPSDFFN